MLENNFSFINKKKKKEANKENNTPTQTESGSDSNDSEKKKKSHRHQTYRKSEAGFRVRMMLKTVESCSLSKPKGSGQTEGS